MLLIIFTCILIAQKRFWFEISGFRFEVLFWRPFTNLP